MLKVIPPQDVSNYTTVLARHRWQKLSKLDHEEIMAIYRRSGAILFRGFRWSVPDFDEFGRRFCSCFVVNKSAGRRLITSDGRVQTVDTGTTFLPLHPEMSREPWKPDVAIFGCEKPPRRSNETLICDGVALARALPPKTREFLEQQTLRYAHPTTREKCAEWLGIEDPDEETLKQHRDSLPFEFYIDKSGHYARVFRVPALHTPMFTDEKAFGNYILVARFLHNIRNFPTLGDGSDIPEELCQELKVIGDKLTVAHKWRKRDILMLDNTRFLHARGPIIEPHKRVILTQFGFLRDAPLSPEELAAQRWRKGPVWVESEAA